jgi:hypothetical protein
MDASLIAFTDVDLCVFRLRGSGRQRRRSKQTEDVLASPITLTARDALRVCLPARLGARGRHGRPHLQLRDHGQCSPFTGGTGLEGTYGYNERKGNLAVATARR